MDRSIIHGGRQMALSNVMTRSLISASSSMKQVKAQHAIKSQMEGKAGVLEAEIKQDSCRGGDVTKKKEELEPQIMTSFYI